MGTNMTFWTMRAVKLAAVGGAAIPIIGFTGRLSAASEERERQGPIRACDISLYPVVRVKEVAVKDDKPEPDALRVQITKFRKWATGVYRDVEASETTKSIKSGYETVRDKALIGVEHSKSTLDYVQTNPGEVPRVAFISVAAMGGFILGYRRSVLRKLLYATIAGLSSAALCYPHFTVDLSQALKEDLRDLWRDNIGWPLTEEPTKNKSRLKKVHLTLEDSKAVKELKGDPGQSVKEDKDLYSTRSS